MTTLTDIIARPLIPIELLIGLAVLAVGLTVFAVARGLPGAWLRVGAALALILALLDPALVREDRAAQSDIVIALVDESASQSIENRAEQTAVALARLQQRIDQMAAQPGADPIELEIRRIPGDPSRGTALGRAIAQARNETPASRLSGIVAITDGALSDDQAVLDALATVFAANEGEPPKAPLHVLATGRSNEFDRRLVVESAPAYGLVGEKVTLRFRVEQSGDAPLSIGLPRVSAYVDGIKAASGFSAIGRATRFTVSLNHPGHTVVELRLETEPQELTDRNNIAAFTINAVRDRLEVLLVSGQPHAGERIWRNLLKSDASVDLVHFTILRPPGKPNPTPRQDLALIPFPTQQLFEEEVDEFDLIIFDRYKNWGRILRDRYIQNIVDYVRGGGAVLVSGGPDFAGFESIFRSPLGDIIPATPTADVVEQPFRPRVTTIGARHPVTRSLPGSGVVPGVSADEAKPSWGRWFRIIDVAPHAGEIVMEGAGARPLLILDRVGEGRVALLASDQPWLWARGYDGGGPQSELLRRLAHWLMQEPELEEEALTAFPSPGGFVVERRSLAAGDKSVRVTEPGGEISTYALSEMSDGLWRVEVVSDVLGVHRIKDAEDSVISVDDADRTVLETIAVVGPPSPREFADPTSTLVALEPVAKASGGLAARLSDLAGDLAFRRISVGDAVAGEDWIGFQRREAFEVRGVTLGDIAPGWIFFLLAAGFILAAWRLEGR